MKKIIPLSLLLFSLSAVAQFAPKFMKEGTFYQVDGLIGEAKIKVIDRDKNANFVFVEYKRGRRDSENLWINAAHIAVLKEITEDEFNKKPEY